METTAPTSRVADGLFLPEGASLLTRLRVAVRALKVLEKDAGDTVAAPLLNACLDGGVYAELSARLLETEEGRELLTTRPALQGSSIDLAALGRLPKGTLGHEFARYFEDNKIFPFESPYEVRNHVDYLAKRYRETHDIAHVLTGYRTDVLGEMELQAFMVGNLGIRTGVLILTYSVVKRLHGLSAREYARKLREAYRRGARSPQLIRVRYERYWETPVEALRQEMGIPPLAAA
jgi:ubiquinone biosynthesis protein COQ4